MAMTNNRSRRRKAPTHAIPPTLPPTVEIAYKRKCVELKRRMNEVEESNDAFRLRKVRLMRGIRKMRLERAILLENLSKRMKKNGVGGPNAVYDDDSEGSSEGPPTPQEKPLRTKRGHRRGLTPPQAPIQALPSSQAHPHTASQAHTLTPGTNVFCTQPQANGTPITPNPLQPLAPYVPSPSTLLGSLAPTASENSVRGAALPPPHPPAPSPMDLYVSRMMRDDFQIPGRLRPGVSVEELPGHYRALWEELPSQDRALWEEDWEAQMREWSRAGEEEDGGSFGAGDA